MKKIPLTQNKEALVDDDDFERMAQYSWSAIYHKGNRSWYAARNIWLCGDKFKKQYMARLIVNAKPHEEVDHANHDTLDNQKENLRVCTRTQNAQNRKKRRFGRVGTWSKFKGVMKKGNLWVVRICYNGKRHFVGGYKDETDAAMSYDNEARKHFGKFAHCNFPIVSSQMGGV